MASTPSLNKRPRLTNSDCEIMDHDRISDLPEHVLDQILTRLSIKEAVRTSVLSTNWRYKWASVTSLVINDNDHKTSSMDSVVDDILLLHMGPVHKFELSCYGNFPNEKVHKWILYLSRHSINELVLRVRDYAPDVRTPSSLFCCQGLTHLDLYGFILSLPSAFVGFKNLKSLILSVEMDQQDVEELISRSPLLERLTLHNIFTLDQLNIHGPNLLYFYFQGRFVDICFRSSPRLAEVYIDVDDINESFEVGNTIGFGDMGHLMAGIPQISRLMFGGQLIEYLGAGRKPRELPITCTNLSYLSFDFIFSRLNEVSLLLCLLRSAPNLEELQIGSQPEYPGLDEDEWGPETSSDARVWDTNGLDSPFTRLRLVKINNFRGTKDEMDFVKFMLLASPALECMTIELEEKLSSERDSTRKFEITKAMLSFKRGSTEAEIKVF